MTPELKKMMEDAEGRVLHMYLDSKGNVTCGVGHLMSTPEYATKIAFTTAGGDVLASSASITAEYVGVKMLPPNHVAGFYEQRTRLRLSEATVDKLLDDDVAQVEAALIHIAPGFTFYPDPARTALTDMAFNLGPAGLRKFPKLMDACMESDWETAAKECHRKGVAESRNIETAALFRGLVTA